MKDSQQDLTAVLLIRAAETARDHAHYTPVVGDCKDESGNSLHFFGEKHRTDRFLIDRNCMIVYNREDCISAGIICVSGGIFPL